MNIEPGVLGPALATAAFLALVVNRLTEALVVSFFDHFKWDKKWLMYGAWGVSSVLIALTTIDIFYFIDWRYPVVGKILTAIVGGGGANLLHDLFDGLLTIADSFKKLLTRGDE